MSTVSSPRSFSMFKLILLACACLHAAYADGMPTTGLADNFVHHHEKRAVDYKTETCGANNFLIVDNFAFPNNNNIPLNYPTVPQSANLNANQLQQVSYNSFVSSSRNLNNFTLTFQNSGYYGINSNGISVASFSKLVIRMSGAQGGEEQRIALNLIGQANSYRLLSQWSTDKVTTTENNVDVSFAGLQGNIDMMALQFNPANGNTDTVYLMEIFLCLATNTTASSSPNSQPLGGSNTNSALTGSSAMPIGPIVGSVIGAVLLLAMIVGGVWVFRYYNTRERVTARNARYIIKKYWTEKS